MHQCILAVKVGMGRRYKIRAASKYRCSRPAASKSRQIELTKNWSSLLDSELVHLHISFLLILRRWWGGKIYLNDTLESLKGKLTPPLLLNCCKNYFPGGNFTNKVLDLPWFCSVYGKLIQHRFNSVAPPVDRFQPKP